MLSVSCFYLTQGGKAISTSVPGDMDPSMSSKRPSEVFEETLFLGVWAQVPDCLCEKPCSCPLTSCAILGESCLLYVSAPSPTILTSYERSKTRGLLCKVRLGGSNMVIHAMVSDDCIRHVRVFSTCHYFSRTRTGLKYTHATRPGPAMC